MRSATKGRAAKVTETTTRYTDKPDKPATSNADAPQRSWIKRLGVAGFAFFLIKGLLWLIIPPLIALGLFGGGE